MTAPPRSDLYVHRDSFVGMARPAQIRHFETEGDVVQPDALQRPHIESGGCDGFNIMPPVIPGEIDLLADELIPILQRRGLFRTEYTGATLRDHVNLSQMA